MEPATVVLAAARFAVYTGTAGLVGLPVVTLLVLRPGLAAGRPSAWAAGRDRLARRLATGVDAAALAAAVGTVVILADLVRRVDALPDPGDGGVQLTDVYAALETDFGTWTAGRLLVLVALMVTVRGQLRDRLTAGSDAAPATATFWAAWLGFGALLAFTVAVSGHAGADERPWLAVPVAFAHLLAVAVWLVGIAVLTLALPTALRGRSARAQLVVFAPTLLAFSRVAFAAAGAVAVTGTAAALLAVEDLTALRGSGYGQALLVKVWLFACVLALGALNRYRLLHRLPAPGTSVDPLPPRAGRHSANLRSQPRRVGTVSAGAAQQALVGTVTTELGLGLLLVATTAVLTGLAPPA